MLVRSGVAECQKQSWNHEQQSEEELPARPASTKREPQQKNAQQTEPEETQLERQTASIDPPDGRVEVLRDGFSGEIQQRESTKKCRRTASDDIQWLVEFQEMPHHTTP